ncbi:hypothetical protein [Tenuifilum thalassicum]|uniref:6-bladed beta-propeller n=1 Tax=Tenuifilum thalassicum TaxID=2590900 RepID=A0A7D4BEG6_9BACT|nr:hypothetical protein [Tenuifilum thalassicum]QKG80683.1 hypothetical protein FHG85_10535 [Tenuifilum thalassicum]
MKNRLLYFASLIFLLLSCNKNNTEKIFNPDENVISVKNRLTEVAFEKPITIGNIEVLDSFIVLQDISNYYDKALYLLNRNAFTLNSSVLKLGKGPGEIAYMGYFTVNRSKRLIYVNDHGKNVVWTIPFDSLLKNPDYLPSNKLTRDPKKLLQEYGNLNDSVMLGIAMYPLTVNSFEIKTTKWDLKSNTITEFGYENPDAQGEYLSTSTFAIFPELNIYLKAHYWVDLLTICNLDGTLKCNIHGPKWNDNDNFDDLIFFFGGVKSYHGYILAAYVGDKGTILDENKREVGNTPNKILVFDSNGNYIATIDVGIKFLSFTADEQNNRIILGSAEATNSLLQYFNLDPKELSSKTNNLKTKAKQL